DRGAALPRAAERPAARGLRLDLGGAGAGDGRRGAAALTARGLRQGMTRLLLALLLLSACASDKADPAGDDTATPGDDTDARGHDTAIPEDDTGTTGEDTAVECPPGSHAEGEGCAAALTGWSEGPALASARDHHVTFAADAGGLPALFALAGTTH